MLRSEAREALAQAAQSCGCPIARGSLVKTVFFSLLTSLLTNRRLVIAQYAEGKVWEKRKVGNCAAKLANVNRYVK